MSKKSKTRDCPAVGRPIKSIECGENRHRSYQCPADCPHSPFSLGNDEQFSLIEDRTDTATIERAYEDRFTKAAIAAAAKDRSAHSLNRWYSTLVNLFFNSKGEDGLLFGERWKQAGYPGLRGDEQFLFDCKRQSRFILLEVQTVEDSETLTGIDLLQPQGERFTIVDRSLAATASRFQRFACIAYPSPNYWRVGGTLATLPKTKDYSHRDALTEIVRHLGGSLEQSWLMANFDKVAEAGEATRGELNRLALLNSDLIEATADYQLAKPPAKLRPKIEKAGFQVDEVSDNEAAAGWHEAYILPLTPEEARKYNAEQAGTTPYLGILLLRNQNAQLHATSKANLDELRSRFESALGPDVAFQKELVSNHAAQRANAIGAADPKLVPPSLLKDPGAFEQTSSRTDAPVADDALDLTTEGLIRSYYERILDQPVPELGGATPRQASQDLQLRPKLIEWAKGATTNVDTQNLHSGINVDINWLFKDLGLHEIDFPPPPPRPIPSSDFDIEDDFEDNFLGDEDQEMEFLDDLIQDRLEEYETAAEALDDMQAGGCDLIEELYAATEGIIGAEQFDIVTPLLICAWLAVVPKGKPLPLPPGLVQSCTQEFLRITAEQSRSPDGTEDEMIAKMCHDPALLLCLLNRLEATNKTLPKKLKLSEADKTSAFATLLIGTNVLLEAYEQSYPF
ncbi:hypothetical protein [Pelagicoccus sp. SDUM812005]|uniref:hypothetical protein n=1 Tax=Pelagicoccus sp. SDUM812005 TaxID=3041257 RepID=UPI00280E6EAA|nr:hypothetical protein [Pelagicoccus sp. SDUM812005]MDQ8182145.1 hypothetical protein [Pelagicoccus sp. SDUM812005]